MMDKTLQIILFVATFCFLIYIINMVRNKKLELRYTLIWLFTAVGLLAITILPHAIEELSKLLHIVEPVNTLFLVIIFFLILIIFSLTRELSKDYLRISALVQEVGIVKLELKNLKEDVEKMQSKE